MNKWVQGFDALAEELNRLDVDEKTKKDLHAYFTHMHELYEQIIKAHLVFLDIFQNAGQIHSKYADRVMMLGYPVLYDFNAFIQGITFNMTQPEMFKAWPDVLDFYRHSAERYKQGIQKYYDNQMPDDSADA